MPTDYDDFLKQLFKSKFKNNTFSTLLSQLSLKEIKNVYEILTGENLNLKKDEYKKLIEDTYLSNLFSLLKNLHSEILDLIFYIVDNQGEISFIDIPHSFVALMKLTLIAYPVLKDNEYKIVMGDTVFAALNALDRKEIYSLVKDNDTIIMYTRKFVEVYGQFDATLLFNYLKEYESIDTNYTDKFFLLNCDSVFSDIYDIKNAVFSSCDIEEIVNFPELLDKHEKLTYHKLSKEEILSDEYTDDENILLDFLIDDLDMDEDMAYDLVDTLLKMIKFEISFAELFLLFEQLHRNKYEMNLLKQHVIAVYENTRRYSLKGHTLKEVNSRAKLIPFKLKK